VAQDKLGTGELHPVARAGPIWEARYAGEVFKHRTLPPRLFHEDPRRRSKLLQTEVRVSLSGVPSLGGRQPKSSPRASETTTPSIEVFGVEREDPGRTWSPPLGTVPQDWLLEKRPGYRSHSSVCCPRPRRPGNPSPDGAFRRDLRSMGTSKEACDTVPRALPRGPSTPAVDERRRPSWDSLVTWSEWKLPTASSTTRLVTAVAGGAARQVCDASRIAKTGHRAFLCKTLTFNLTTLAYVISRLPLQSPNRDLLTSRYVLPRNMITGLVLSCCGWACRTSRHMSASP